MQTLSLEAKTFYRKMLLIGIPVVLQNLISIGLNLIDSLMIGKLGEAEVAAVGAANQVYFVYVVTLFGFYAGAAVHTAQYWGAGDVASVRKMLGIDYLVGAAFSIGVSAFAFLWAPQIMGWFSDDPAVISLGTDYMRIACFSYLFAGLSMAISYNSRAIQNLTLPTIVNAVALALNAVLNYLLIFGIGSFPKMGVEGAAMATLIARIFEFIVMFAVIYLQKSHPFKTGAKQLFGFSREFFLKACRTAVPVVFSEFSWAGCVALIFMAYGKIGTEALAVAQVANTITDMLQSFFFGVGNAAVMLIGETLGQGNKELAYVNGKRSIHATWVLNVVITVVLFAVSGPVTGFFNFDDATLELLRQTLIMMAILITPKMLSYIYVCGVLRAGGDTMFCMYLELFCNILIQVPMAYIAVLALHTTLPIAMAMVTFADIVRIVLCVPRYRSKKWINVIVE
ncbi:MAG: MATE family efflux transporter [Firmicutes bacterium]|nr:MATE family efflux transporter [Bacillota bacterium]